MARADPAVVGLLAGLVRYLHALSDEERDLEHLTEQVIRETDVTLREGDPVAVLAFYQIASGWRQARTAERTSLSVMSEALQRLSEAEAKLKAADGKNNGDDLSAVLTLLAEVLTDIHQVQATIQARGSHTP